MEDDIREGFLCPICLKDLKSPTNLACHFEESHADDKDVLQQLRSVFGKAKRKLLKQDESSTKDIIDGGGDSQGTISHGTPATGGIDLALWDTQVLGVTYSHMKMLRQERKEAVERCVVETNKLLIRLEKLIKSGVYSSDSSLPGAIKTRKNMEKTVVPWQNDNQVRYCPNCMKKFSMTYRRHHCRLCGKVICERCLANLDMLLACDVLKLDASTASSLVKITKNSDGDSENGLKACDPCQELLIRQNKLNQDKSAHSILLQLYDRMHSSMREADGIQPSFLKMADSVNAGETEYGIDVAMETRVRLLKAYESVEALSKRIQHLGLEKEKQPHPQILKLQRSIRSYASNYLADNMFTLPALPSKEQYNELVKKNKRERQRLKAEKAAVPSAKTTPVLQRKPAVDRPEQVAKGPDVPDATYDNNQNGFFRTSTSMFKSWKKESRPVFQAVSISKKKDSSWGPVQVATEKSADPIIQQIENIRGYIKQAQDDKRWDEVKMFEQNLKELELIYLEKQRV